MISFDAGRHRFDLRAAAVLVAGDRVLLHRLDDETFWALPGGRVEAGERAEDAVVREMREELAEEVDCGPLLFVVENFFRHAAREHHEVGLYFAVSAGPASRLSTRPGPFCGSEGGKTLTFAWFDRSRLQAIDLRPSFLVDALAHSPLEFRHVVHRDSRDSRSV